MDLSKFKVLTFDCYGTLIDWECGIVEALRAARFRSESAGELLKIFASVESPIQQENPDLLYPQVLERAIEKMSHLIELDGEPLTSEEVHNFGASISNWPAFEDSASALQYLQSHFKLVILSNVNRESFALSEAKLGVKFDLICTAQDIGSYKPDLQNFRYLLDQVKNHFNVEKDEVLHVFQSLYHDAIPANEIGISTCHIDREPYAPGGGATPSSLQKIPKLDLKFKTLREFADYHKKETNQ